MKRYLPLMILSLLLIGAGCVTAPDPAQEGTSVIDETETPSLTDREWTWTHTETDDGETITPEQTDAFTLTFEEDGSFHGTTDCNNYFGSYETEGSSLSFGPIASTKMYCEGSQELIYTGALGETDGFAFDDAGNLIMILRSDSGSMIFE